MNYRYNGSVLIIRKIAAAPVLRKKKIIRSRQVQKKIVNFG